MNEHVVQMFSIGISDVLYFFMYSGQGCIVDRDSGRIGQGVFGLC